MAKHANKFSCETKNAIYHEAMLCFILEIFIWSCAWLLFFLIDMDNTAKRYFLILTILCFIISVFFNYWTALLALVDSAKGNTVKKSVRIIDFKTEGSWSGWLWHSNIPRFYPENKMVDKFKLYFVDENGKKKFVRAILSIEKRKIIYKLFLDNPNNTYVDICYLKNSKILLSFDLPSESKDDKDLKEAICKLNKRI